ncbi:hypothetical protein ACO0LC_21660 [Undibacterium sp. JH2W]|uniref:hypothetical protein n=1 Tax=Undibacterium sp. JH2W TaxID=3413037 RepID=UPI003BEFFDBB
MIFCSKNLYGSGIIMKHVFLLLSLATACSMVSHAQTFSASSKNNMTPVAVNNAAATNSLTITLTAKGEYILSSEKDKNLKKSGKLGSSGDVDALNKKMQEMKSVASEIRVNIKAEQAARFQYLVDIASTQFMQAQNKFTITTETSLCTVQAPTASLATNAAHITVQISTTGDYALQLSDKAGKPKGGSVSYRREKKTNLAEAIVLAKKTDAGIYALIDADKDAPVQAYVDLVNILNSASVDRQMIIVESAGKSTQSGPEKTSARTQQVRIEELEAQQKQMLEQLKKVK